MAVDYDVVVIGSGAGGSIAARVFAKKGLKVLVLEKGENYYPNLATGDFQTTFYGNDELKFGTRDVVGTDPLIEPRSFRTGTDRERDFVGDVNSLPSTVGGGLTHADWKARRLRPADFRLKDLLGRVPGASVVNWPIRYRDLEPFYDIAERVVGVQGPDEIPFPFGPPRSRPYPMPPGVPQYSGLVLSRGARRSGFHPFPAPTGITSRPWRDRPPCNDCGFDGDFGCPIGAKGTPAVTALRDALLTGNVTLLSNAMVTRLNAVENGDKRRIESVEFLDENLHPRPPVTANLFVLAASAIESARLAILSGLDRDGWGNSSGLLGKNLMFHFQTLAIGVFPQRLHPYRGRTITHMLDDFAGPASFELARVWPFPRGGTVELGGTQNVIDEGKNYQRGPQHKTLMRVSPLRDRIAALTMQGEDLPQEGNFVDLDEGDGSQENPGIHDIYGLPVARITYRSHPYELAASAFYTPLMLDVLKAAGAAFAAPLGSDLPKGILPAEVEQGIGGAGALSAVPSSRHIMGTLRMGSSRKHGVTDPFGKFWDLENLYSADGAVFPTSGGMNPSLTIMALAYRAAAAVFDRKNPQSVIGEIDDDLL